MPSNRATVVVRADGCEEIGLGHLTRCRSLALALRDAGARVVFAVSPRTLPHAGPLASDGFEIAAVGGTRLDRLGAVDAAATAALGAEWALVDHYGADEGYLRALARAGVRVAVVDDLGDRDLGCARWILNQNLGADASLYGPAGGRTILLGPAYALLRPQFAAARASLAREFTGDDYRVLVTFGGGAPAEQYAAVVEALGTVRRPLEIRVLTGRDEPPSPLLERVAADSTHDVEIAGLTAAMARQLAWADVVVAAGGSTCWELLALGAPAVVVSLSPDQTPNVEALADAELALAADADDPFALAGSVARLLGDPVRREAMSLRGRALVDGHGAARAAASLLALVRPEEQRAVA